MSNQQASQSFENNFFKVLIEETAGCQVKAKVEVSKEFTQKTYKQAVKKINKEVSVPGFRKGKAPDQTVIKNYSSYIEQEWKEILVNDALKGALDLTKVYPLNRESIQKPKIESCSLENGAVINFAYERYPQIPVIDFSKLQLKNVEKQTIQDERIEEVLEEIQRAHATWEDINDKVVQDGDYVDVTIDAIDQDPPKTIVTDRRFEVSEKRMIPWLRKLIVGLSVGAVVEGYSELDDKADEEVKAKFKRTHCRVALNGIKKIIPHELNDELAKKAGGSSLDDLKSKIRANLEQEAEMEAKEKQVHNLEMELLANYPFEIPSSMFEGERRWRIKDKIRDLKHQNMSDEEIKSKEQEIEVEVSKEADEALRLYFLGKQIAEQGKITISNQELNQELIRHISQNPNYYGQDSDNAASQELISRLASNLMQRKAREYAIAQIAR